MNKLLSKIVSVATAAAMTLFVSSGSLQTFINEIDAHAAETDIFLGDVNDDDKVDVFDLCLMKRELVEPGATSIDKVAADVNADGVDLKQFIKQFLNFVLDVSKYSLAGIEFTNLPNTEGLVTWLNKKSEEFDKILTLMDILVNLNSEIKYDDNPKYMIEATLLTRRIE